MKALVVYYSFDGNSEYVAGKIGEDLGADVLKLRAGNEPPTGPLKYLVGGRAALRGEKAILYRVDKRPEEYDLIIVGGPVWAGTMPPALREFMIQYPFEKKRTAIFACSGSGRAAGMLEKMRAMLAGNEVLAELSLRSPLKDKEKTDLEIKGFVKELKGRMSISEEAAFERAAAAADETVKAVEDELASAVAAELMKKEGIRG